MKQLLSLLALLLLASCGAEQSQSSSPRKVRCTTIQSLDRSTVSVSYPARLEPVSEVNLSFRIAGVVENIAVKEGDYVRRGDKLAQLDRRDYLLQLEATEAEYDGVKAEVDRLVELYEEQSVAANTYDKATSGLRRITAALEAHRNALSDTELRAPFDGYIQKINFQAPEAISAGMPIISIISATAPEVVMSIPAEELLRRDQLLSASARIELFGEQPFELRALGVTRKANLNQLYESRFQLISNGEKSPTAGMSAMVTLTYSQAEGEFMIVPFAAIVENHLWRVVNSRAERVAIEVVEILPSGEAVVRGEIAAGEQIISAGLASLREGMQVEPTQSATKSNVGNLL